MQSDSSVHAILSFVFRVGNDRRCSTFTNAISACGSSVTTTVSVSSCRDSVTGCFTMPTDDCWNA